METFVAVNGAVEIHLTIIRQVGDARIQHYYVKLIREWRELSNAHFESDPLE